MRTRDSLPLLGLIVGAFLSAAVMGLVVTLVLFSGNRLGLLWALIVYAAVWGCGNGLVASCQWEMIGRGVSASRRGLALATGVFALADYSSEIGRRLFLIAQPRRALRKPEQQFGARMTRQLAEVRLLNLEHFFVVAHGLFKECTTGVFVRDKT